MTTPARAQRPSTRMSATFGSVRLPVTAALATILGSICLGTTFLTGAWFFPAVFAVVVTAGGAELARRMSAPRSFVPLTGAVALLLYLVLVYAHDQAYLGFIPNHDALVQLQSLVRSGRQDIARFAAPIAVSPGIELLVTTGVGLVALAVDTLAVTMRRAALAGLPLLALYTVPTTVAPGGVGWLAFALGGIGYLTLLLAEARERVSRWGRPMRYTAPRANWHPDVETAPLAQVGRRVGAAALGLALVVPAVLPDVTASSFGFGGNGFGGGPGRGHRVNVINPIIDLGKDLRRGQNVPVISYTGPPDYLRLVGLDLFTGDKWDPSTSQVSNRKNDVREGLVNPPGLASAVERKTVTRTFKIFDLDETWLPLAYPTRRVTDIEGKWLYDESTFNVFPQNGSTRGLTYTAKNYDVAATAEQLRAAGTPPDSVARYLDLPAVFPKIISDTAAEVTKGASTPFDKAVALQQWLRGPAFSYNAQVTDTLGDSNGLEAISLFLETRQGYCVHFASTMAVMARRLNIPARVAVGFTPGRYDRKTKQNIVSLHDAHAWPELYFQGTGWVRFEPTPAGARTPAPDYTLAAAVGNGAPSTPNGQRSATARGGDSPQSARVAENKLNATLEGRDVPKRRAETVVVGNHSVPLLPFALALGAVLLALVPMTARIAVRRRRWRRATGPAALATATWDELLDTLLDYGYEWPVSDPPRRGAVRLADERGLTGEAKAALQRLAAATERARYATDLGAVGDLRADVETVRGALAAGAGRGGRLRARFLPRSARAVSSALSEQLADLLDGLDGLVGRLRPRRT